MTNNPIEKRDISDLAYSAADKLAPIFRMFGWEWKFDGEYRVPSHREIAIQVQSMCCSLEENSCLSTHRITVDLHDSVFSVMLDIEQMFCE